MATTAQARRWAGGGWLKRAGLRLAVLIGLLGTWQVVGVDDAPATLPTFTGTMAALGDIVGDGRLVSGLIATNQALAFGFLAAAGFSVPLGIVMGSNRLLARVAQPYLTIFLAVPTIALVPIIQTVFGLTLTARVVIVFLFSFVYIAINTMVGVQTIDPSLKQMARSFGASRPAMLREVILPGALPGVMSGVRLGLGRALVGMVVAELALVGAGVGSLIVEFQGRIQIAHVLAVVVAILLEGIILMEVARRLESRLAEWRTGTTKLQ